MLRHDFAQIMKSEQPIDVETLAVEDIATTKRQNAGGRDVDACAAKNPHLHRDVVLVHLLDVGAGLDLDEIESPAQAPLQNVDAHEDAAMLERRLEDGGNRSIRDQRTGLGDGLLRMR